MTTEFTRSAKYDASVGFRLSSSFGTAIMSVSEPIGVTSLASTQSVTSSRCCALSDIPSVSDQVAATSGRDVSVALSKSSALENTAHLHLSGLHDWSGFISKSEQLMETMLTPPVSIFDDASDIIRSRELGPTTELRLSCAVHESGLTSTSLLFRQTGGHGVSRKVHGSSVAESDAQSKTQRIDLSVACQESQHAILSNGLHKTSGFGASGVSGGSHKVFRTENVHETLRIDVSQAHGESELIVLLPDLHGTLFLDGSSIFRTSDQRHITYAFCEM
jgi:hypothetical protein